MSNHSKYMEWVYNHPNYDMFPSEYEAEFYGETEASTEQIEKDLEEDKLND